MKKNTKILILFLAVNYIHLTPTVIKFLKNLNELKETPLLFSLWSVGLALLWIFLPFYLLISFIGKKVNENFLYSYLVVVYFFLFPLYFLNIGEILFSNIERTLLMIGKFGLFQIWASALVFVFTTAYIILNLVKSLKNKKLYDFKNFSAWKN